MSFVSHGLKNGSYFFLIKMRSLFLQNKSPYGNIAPFDLDKENTDWTEK